MWRKCTRFLGLSGEKRLLLLEALCALLAARLALLLLPFRRIAAWLGQAGEESAARVSEETAARARRVGWAVGLAAPQVPWDSRCLAQGLAGAWMLGRRGIPATLYFGVRKEAGKAFSAHAWLRCGEEIVTGAAGHETFNVLVCFSRSLPPDGQ